MHLAKNVRLPISDQIGQDVTVSTWKIIERSVTERIQTDGTVLHLNKCLLGGWILQADMDTWGRENVVPVSPFIQIETGLLNQYLLTEIENQDVPLSYLLKLTESMKNAQDINQEMNLHRCDNALVSTGFIGFQDAEVLS